MGEPEILVTGGTGTLGSRVVERLLAAVRGADTIVRCASNPPKPRQTDAAGTERLLQEAARAVREGAQLCPDKRYGTVRWEEFLGEKVRHQRVSGHSGEGIR